jgi:hypothetical protein
MSVLLCVSILLENIYNWSMLKYKGIVVDLKSWYNIYFIEIICTAYVIASLWLPWGNAVA